MRDSIHEVSPSPERPQRRSIFEWLGKRTVAVALTGVLSAVAGAAIEKELNPGVSKPEAEAIAQLAAGNAVTAERLAAYYTKEVNDAASSGAYIRDAQFLNGAIIDHSDRKHPQKYTNLIVLSLYSESGEAHYDANGDFLKGAHLGVAGTDSSTGKISISEIPYDTKNSEFKPYDSNPNNLVVSTEAYVQGGKDGDRLYAFDANKHQTRMNPDGTAFSPVLVS